MKDDPKQIFTASYIKGLIYYRIESLQRLLDHLVQNFQLIYYRIESSFILCGDGEK
ncbi:hypothetical protein J5U22_01698 [Saccharolobus shibatae]|uniref:Uncharacterized protein n=1 Tax=Saccharolobus shibatae TaxID=2286 RepID=A0A8F5C1A6_9CREN|nr:hypothetical protein J5U22_01698 [Saccharolobus shibatae]